MPLKQKQIGNYTDQSAVPFLISPPMDAGEGEAVHTWTPPMDGGEGHSSVQVCKYAQP